MKETSNASMSLAAGAPHIFGHGKYGTKQTQLGGYQGSMGDLTSLHNGSQHSNQDQEFVRMTTANAMAFGDITSNMNESIESFTQGSQTQVKNTPRTMHR